MNILKLFRLSMLFFLMLFFSFFVQFCFTFQNKLDIQKRELKIAAFLKNAQSLQDEILQSIEQLKIINIVEYVDKNSSYEKAIEFNPELSSVVSKEDALYPEYIVLNNPKANNIEDLIAIKNALLSLDYIEDVCYDEVAYSNLFYNINLFNKYKIISIVLLSCLFILFCLKLTLFCLKKDFRNIFINIVNALLVVIIAYGAICFCAIVKNNEIFILDWKILYILLPISIMINFLSTQSNVKN